LEVSGCGIISRYYSQHLYEAVVLRLFSLKALYNYTGPNIIAGTPDIKTDGSSSKLKKVANDIQFITYTFNVKIGLVTPSCIWNIDTNLRQTRTHINNRRLFRISCIMCWRCVVSKDRHYVVKGIE
jgi:hypothetical protein